MKIVDIYENESQADKLFLLLRRGFSFQVLAQKEL